MKFYDQVKQQVTVNSTQQILLNKIGNVTPAAETPPSAMQDVRRTLGRQKRMAGNPLPVPVNIINLFISDYHNQFST